MTGEWMCGVCTTKGLYEMNSMSEYPYEDKIHSDDSDIVKISSDRIKMVISLPLMKLSNRKGVQSQTQIS